MKVRVQRSDPGTGMEVHYQEYNVPFEVDSNSTIMDVLDYIFNNCDPSLSYFSHSTCNHGICGRCGVKVNGKVKLACLCSADAEEITIEPKNEKVIKDLVTR